MTNTGTSLACYGCIEFANNERTFAYYKWACKNDMFPQACRPAIETLCFCPADSPESPFTNPIDDNACWYDPAAPESAEFLGVVILNDPVTGSTVTREVSDAFIQGSILNRITNKGRSFVFDVFLLATSEEGMNYGEEWLRGVLEDTACRGDIGGCQSCSGRRMSLRVACPVGETLDQGIHEWLSVGIVDGLQDANDNNRKECCSVINKMTFTMQSESPYSFSPNSNTICDVDADPDGYTRCFDWFSGCLDCCDDNTLSCDRCLNDPVCSCFAFSIPEPAIPSDPCEGCVPLATQLTSCCSPDLPSAYDTTFKIDIYSGVDIYNDEFQNSGLRDYKILFYQNPKGLPCITDDDSFNLWCNEEPCFEISTNYIPYDSTLTIDGRTEKVTLTCNGVCRPYGHVIKNAKGPIFPMIANCVPIMVLSEFSYYSTQFLPESPGIKPSHVTVTSYLRFKN